MIKLEPNSCSTLMSRVRVEILKTGLTQVFIESKNSFELENKIYSRV